MDFNKEIEDLAKSICTEEVSPKRSGHKMSKAEFMSRYINDMYQKRYKERHNEADEYLIRTAISNSAKYERKKSKGVFKYEY